MKNNYFKIVYKIDYDQNDYEWSYEYIPQKNEEVEIKVIRYVVADKTFYYDDGILRITLMRLGR